MLSEWDMPGLRLRRGWYNVDLVISQLVDSSGLKISLDLSESI